jgi:hypothetical protein
VRFGLLAFSNTLFVPRRVRFPILPSPTS